MSTPIQRKSSRVPATSRHPSFLHLGKATLLRLCSMNEALSDESTPRRARCTIKAALAYIKPASGKPSEILPTDLADLVGVVSNAESLVRQHIKPQHCKRAEKSLNELFPPRRASKDKKPRGQVATRKDVRAVPA